LEKVWRDHGDSLHKAFQIVLRKDFRENVHCELVYACRPHADGELILLNPFYTPRLLRRFPLNPRQAEVAPRGELLVLLVHELIHHVLSPELELDAHRAALRLTHATVYSKLHRLIGVLEVEILREAGFLSREPELAFREASLYGYLLAGLRIDDAIRLREEFLKTVYVKGVIEAIGSYLRKGC